MALIQASIKAISKQELRFKASKVGMHSNHLRAATVMYMAGVPVYTIMLIGRWSSDAFLHYIRKQVQEFTSSISGKMVMNPNFYTVLDELFGTEDPMVAGNLDNFAT
eukprot:15092243-Ditylum_brightwellii.AAC.1